MFARKRDIEKIRDSIKWLRFFCKNLEVNIKYRGDKTNREIEDIKQRLDLIEKYLQIEIYKEPEKVIKEQLKIRKIKSRKK